MKNKKIGKGAESKTAPFPFDEHHQKVCESKQDHYIDPDSGYLVMTSFFLKNRGYCCENACRHCPYGFNGVNKKKVEDV